MKKLFLLLVSLTMVAVASAADNKPAEEAFNRYWGAYSKKDFAKAATEILPSDLEATKSALLPVFLAGQNAKSKEAQEVLAAFYGKTVGKAREAMTAADVYAGLNRIVAAGSPDLFDGLKDAAVSLIFVRAVSPESVEIHFQVTLRGNSDTDMEALVKKDGRWWVKIKDDPKEAAANFKQLFAK